jgi:hypothetical protein
VLGKWALKERRYGVASAKLSRNAKWNAFRSRACQKNAPEPDLWQKLTD